MNTETEKSIDEIISEKHQGLMTRVISQKLSGSFETHFENGKIVRAKIKEKLYGTYEAEEEVCSVEQIFDVVDKLKSDKFFGILMVRMFKGTIVDVDKRNTFLGKDILHQSDKFSLSRT